MANNGSIFKNTRFDLFKLIQCLLFLAAFGALQTTLFLNLSFLFTEPSLFPKADFSSVKIDVVCMLIASLFLIYKSAEFHSKRWWISFIAMYVGLGLAKFFGVYFDNAVYDIARFRNETIGGGAAFGHLFFIVYLFGSAQFITALAWKSTLK